jgi:hypothetical protein
MGGRGASSGISKAGKVYGTEYNTIYQVENIKFIVQNEKTSIKTPMETMIKDRIYVTLGNDNVPKSITFYDEDGKRNKQIDLTHFHKINDNLVMPHTHRGYWHAENGTAKLSTKEEMLIDKILKKWEDYRRGK